MQMQTERTQVGIIGAGPAGLMLAHLLRRAGIACVVLESKSRAYIETRVRAGLLEQGSVDLIDEIGAGERLHREALEHHGVGLRFAGQSHRIDIRGLTGRSMYIYGQQEVVKDLVALFLADGGDLRFEVADVAVEAFDTDRPVIRFTGADGRPGRLACDYIAGCDGFHGIAREAIPTAALRTYDRQYPFAWLGILSESPPLDDELLYVHHPDGFALFTMRSASISRLYLQVALDEDINAWSDDRIWSELHHRLEGRDAPPLVEGPVLQKGITQMRSFVATPMRSDRLFLAGDAAHIVPPTGAKGMNLALGDVAVLAVAFERFYRSGSTELLDAYSDTALRRVWGAERFSWWLTSLMHVFDDRLPFDDQMQLSELHYVTSTRTGAALLAEQYVGLPIERTPARAGVVA
jgi:p-hydroxybenzoate 3-monooxygenase